MKRMKGGEEGGDSSPGNSSPEVCKKVRTQNTEDSEAGVASEFLDSDWARLPQELLLHIFQYLPLLDRAYASQVCRGWNQAFHMPELWRCFEFELNQPASSYLKATHPDLIKQIIKRHSNHLQYVSFKVGQEKLFCLCQKMLNTIWFKNVVLCSSNDIQSLFVLARWTVVQSLQRQHVTFFHSW